MTDSGKIRKINKTFVRQHSRFYCGLACLASVTRFHGGDTTQEKLQAISGTTLNGTSLLGLYQAAKKSNFDARGYEATTESLKGLDAPVILHTITYEGFEHFVVCYGYNNGKFIIGDPGRGVVSLTEPEVEAIWKSKALLMLTPDDGFKAHSAIREKKREWFFQLIKPDLPVLSIAAFIGVVISVLGLATAIFTQKIIDRFIPEKDMGNLIAGLIIFGLVLIARAIMGYVRTVFLVRQGKDMNIRLVSGFFGKLLYLPKPFFDSTTTGDKVARLNDAQRIQRVVVSLSSQVTIDILIALTSYAYIFSLSVSAGIISLLAVPFFGAVAWLFNKRIIKSQQQVMQTYAATESKYIDTLQGIKAIKSYNSENLFSKIVNLVYSVYMQSAYKLGLISAKLSFWVTLVSSLWLTMIISWVTWQVLGGQLLLGQMMAIIQGYATVVNENSSNLSGGQRQLVALARALYKKPKLLLLNEATAAMDRRTEKFVVGLIKKLKHEIAVVIVTHRPQLASLADTIYVIENNTIAISGNPGYVFQNNLLFRESFSEMPVLSAGD